MAAFSHARRPSRSVCLHASGATTDSTSGILTSDLAEGVRYEGLTAERCSGRRRIMRLQKVDYPRDCVQNNKCPWPAGASQLPIAMNSLAARRASHRSGLCSSVAAVFRLGGTWPVCARNRLRIASEVAFPIVSQIASFDGSRFPSSSEARRSRGL